MKTTPSSHCTRCLFLFDRALRRTVLALIFLYRRLLSPFLGGSCRFYPSCSLYAEQAFRAFSFPRALRLSVWRLLRCNPFCTGGYDPLPGPPPQHPSISPCPSEGSNHG